jgi:hypothetical protein
VQAADRSAKIMARAMIGGRGSRDEEPSFEVKGVVMAALLDVEQ